MPLPESDPVTDWLRLLEKGDRSAAQPLWEYYAQQLLRLARQRLRCCPRRVADEEDVALSAFASFCSGVAAGRSPELTDRDSLWAHLFGLVIRHAHYLIKKEHCLKRGGGAVRDEAALDGPNGEAGLEQLASSDPTPEFIVLMDETCRHLLELLPDPELRLIAQWKLEGYTNGEIAGKLGCVRRSVERKVKLIRNLWIEVEQLPRK